MAEVLTGAQRAAIFLLGIGEEAATEVMRHLEPKEVQKVGAAMANLPNVSNDQLAGVIGDFSSALEQQNSISFGADDYARRVMVQALGEEKATNVLSGVMKNGSSKGLEALKWMDARAVAAILKGEHPQISAIVLSSLEGDQAAAILLHLPAEKRSEIVMRIARLESISAAALDELDGILEKQIALGTLPPPQSRDGMRAAADILNFMDSRDEEQIISAVKQQDEQLGDAIRDLMFVFENLMTVSDKGIQRLLREISVDNLVIALKGTDDVVQQKFFGNMSSRAAEMLKEDLEVKGPVRLSEVEAAQREILTVAVKLAEDGEIILGGKGGEAYV